MIVAYQNSILIFGFIFFIGGCLTQSGLNTTTNEYYNIILRIVLATIIISAGYTQMTVCSKITYAYSRDNALPFSNFFMKIDAKTGNPDGSTLLCSLLGVLICLLPLISSSTLLTLIQLTAIAFPLYYAVTLTYGIIMR
jgi:amino acid transporter